GLPLTVRLDPPGTIFTNGTVPFSVTTSNGSIDNIQIVKNGVVVATLTAAPYHYDYDSTLDAEGTVTIVARANHGSTQTDSAATSVEVDRTSPRALSLLPNSYGV